MLVDHGEQFLSLLNPAEIFEKTIHGILEPGNRPVGGVRREQYVREAVEGVAGGERLDVKDIESGSADGVLLQCFDEGAFDDDGSAADVDDDGGALQSLDLRGSEAAAGLWSEWGAHDQVVDLGQDRIELVGGDDAVDMGVGLGEMTAPPADDHVHAEGFGELRGCLPDAAVAVDGDFGVTEFVDVERLPALLLLLLLEARDALGEVQHAGDGELGEAAGEHSGGVGDGKGTVDELGEELAFHTGHQRVIPDDLVKTWPQGLDDVAAKAAVEDEVRIGIAGEFFRLGVNNGSHGTGQAREVLKVGGIRFANHPENGVVGKSDHRSRLKVYQARAVYKIDLRSRGPGVTETRDMAPRCTCGAYPPDDAMFCHKCGRPLYETAVLDPEPAMEMASPPVPPPLPQEEWNRSAASRAAVISGIVCLTPMFVPLPAGLKFLAFFIATVGLGGVAVFLYRRATKRNVTIPEGLRLGQMAGLVGFVFVTLQFTIEYAALEASGNLEKVYREAIPRQGVTDAEIQQMLEMMRGPWFIVLALLMMLAVFTVLPMIGGALAAGLRKR